MGFRDRRPGARDGKKPTVGSSMEPLDAANDHDTGKQIARTQQIWQPRFGRDLTDEDARQIMHNVTSFFGVLAEWARADRMAAAAATDSASPQEGEGVGHDR